MSKEKLFRSMPSMDPSQLQTRVPHVAVDRLGHAIEVGHLVMFHSSEDLIFEVIDVRPVLNPTLVAAGQQAMQVTLQTKFPVQVRAAMPNRGMVIVGESEARIHARTAAANNGPKVESTDSPDLSPQEVRQE